MVADFRKKKNAFQGFLLVAGGVLIISLCGVLVVADAKMYQKRKILTAQVATLENKIKDIKDSNEELQKDRVQADEEEYIRKVGREELDEQLPGEKVVSFIMPETQKNQDVAKEENIGQKLIGSVSSGWNWFVSQISTNKSSH
jgi:cell division protein FtsB